MPTTSRSLRALTALALICSVSLVVGSAVRVTAAPADPASTVTPSTSSPLLGEDISFVVTFDNADTTETGYGPYVDLTFDAAGADGAGAAVDDGVTFVSASYLGAPLAPLANFACTGTAQTHPLTGASIPCPAGDQIVVLQLPFGSFTPGQPIANVDVIGSVSDLADVGFGLDVSSRPGFAYGNSPTGSTPIIGTTDITTLVPEILRFTKSYDGPEEETATGPNFPRAYSLDVDVAPGQTVVDLTITDRLPVEYAYLASTAVPAVGTTSPEPTVGVPSSPPNNVLSHEFTGNLVGSGAAIDASLDLNYFIPAADAAAATILDPADGDDETTVNDGEASGTVDPLDARDADIAFTVNSLTVDPVNDDDAQVIAKSIAVQKSVTNVVDVGSNGPTPGDTIQYTINGQVSDYFTFAGVVVDDVLSDGQTFDAGFVPTLTITERGTSTAVSLVSHFTVDTSARTSCGDGTTAIDFRVSEADNALPSGDGILTGGRVGTAAGGTTFQITFQATIDDQYACPPPDTRALDPNDFIDNDVTVTGEIYDSVTQAPQTVPQFEADTSSAGMVISPLSIEKSIWARNAVVGSFTNPVQFAAGDLITYRLKMTIPSSDFSDLLIADYLPLPVLTATALSKQVADCTAVSAPPLGQWCFGPDDTLHDAPSFVAPANPTVDAVANSLTWDYGTQEFADNIGRDIELLFTLQISDDPFLDGLFLTNQVEASDENSFNTPSATPAIVQIELTEPALNIRKGAVTASTQSPAASFAGPRNPTGVTFDAVTTAGACPDFSGTVSSDAMAGGAPNANVSGIDGSDLVRFAIVVENTGSGLNGAFDVEIADAIPAGFELPGAGPDLCVTDGAGSPLAHTAGGFLAGTPSSNGTVTLTDGATGAIGPFDATSGANVAVVTYVLQAVNTIGANTPASELTNTATIDGYAATEGGPSFLAVTPAADLSDTATTTTKRITIGKSRTDTSQPSTSGADVAIGEEVEYTVTVTIPEGVCRDVALVDTLPAGLEISRTPAAAVLGGSLAASAITGPTVSPNSRVLTYGFGDVTNSGTDNVVTASDQITFTYWAVVTNVAANQRGANRQNSAAISYLRGSTGSVTSTHTAGSTVTIVEPTLRVRKSASSPTIDADDTITYTIVVDHDPSLSDADAFDVSLTDVIPSGLTFVPSSLAQSGTPATSLTFTGPDTITASWSSLLQAQSTTITFDVTVDPAYNAVSTITNTAALVYTGLPGSPTTPLANPDGIERTGAGGVDDYATSDSVVLQPIAPTIGKALVDTDQATTTSPDLTIGEIATYDLTVTLPEGAISGFSVTDELPAGLEYVAGSLEIFTAPGTESPTSGLGQPFAGTLGATTVTGGVGDGDDLVVTFGSTSVTPDGNDANNSIVVRLDALVLDVAGNVGFTPGQTTLDNRGVVQLSGSTAVNSGFVSTPVVEPRLVITKAFNPTTASQGDAVTVELQVENTGLGTAHDVIVEDTLDAYFDETTAAEGTTPAGFTYSHTGSTISYTGGSIAAGATANFSFTVTLDAVVPIGTTIPNTARVTQATTLPGAVAGERDEPDVSGSANLNTVGPDLTLDKDDGITTIVPGSQTTYDLVVTNVGGFQATGVYIDDTLPAATTLVGIGGAGCTDGGDVGGARRILVGGAIAGGGGSVTCTITIEMTAPAPAGTTGYLNQAVVTDDGVNGPDPTPGNNSAQDNDTIAGRAPDVQVTKDDGVTSLVAGAQTTYTVSVTNTGNIGVTNVLVTDTLPAGLTFNACNELTGTVSISCAESGGVVTITYASLAGAGGAASFEIVADVENPISAGRESVTNSVTAADDGANGADVDPADNSDTDIDTISAQPDMVISKTHTQTDVAPGGTVDYELTVDNAGTQNATGVTVTDTVDSQLTVDCASVNPTPTSCDAGTGVITWGPGLEDSTATIATTFVAGGSRTLTYSTTADDPVAAGTTAFANTATVTDDDGTADGDPTPANNTAVDSIPLVGNGPDLQIDKDDSLTSVVPGQVIDYTLDVTNAGNIGASGVVITDTLPDTVEFVSCSDACDSSGLPVVTWTVGSIPGGGGNRSVTITVRVIDPAAAGVETITNVATVADDAANGPDADPTDNTDDDIDTLDAAPNLVVTKDDGATARAAGETFDYTIVVANNGDQVATGVTVVDTLPSSLSAVSCPAAPVGCTIDGTAGTVTWIIGTLNGGADDAPPAPSSDATLTFTATVDPTVASTVESFTNTVDVTDDGTNSGGTPITATDDDTDDLVAAPDLHLTKDDGVTTVAPGDVLSYDIVITNVGTQAATGVTVTDTLPPGVTFVSCAPTCDATALPTIVWTDVVEDVPGTPADATAFDTLGQATLTLVVTVDTPAAAGLETLDNVAGVTDDGTNGADPTPGDNSDNDVDTVDAAPDLVVTKDDGVDFVTEGQIVAYEITFTNAGDQHATGVVITDVLPDEVSFVSCSDSCDATADPSVSWAIGDLAPGDGGTVTITAVVDDPLDPATRHVVNRVTIADDGTNGADPTPDDNIGIDDDTFGIDLAVAKTDGRTTAVPGEDLTYTVTVTNNGPTTVQQFVLTDTLPPELTDVAFTPSEGSYVPETGVWSDIGDFEEGDTLELLVTGRVDAAATGELTNTVVVTPPTGLADFDATNDRAVDIDTLTPQSALVVDKSLATELVNGRTARYEITVRNEGPSVATEITITDELPAGITFVSTTAPGWTCSHSTSNVVTCILDAGLAVGTSASLSIDVTVNGSPGSTVTNRATASIPTGLGTSSTPSDVAVGTIAAPATSPLPGTGSDVADLLLLSAILLASGTLLNGVRRRRGPAVPS